VAASVGPRIHHVRVARLQERQVQEILRPSAFLALSAHTQALGAGVDVLASAYVRRVKKEDLVETGKEQGSGLWCDSGLPLVVDAETEAGEEGDSKFAMGQ